MTGIEASSNGRLVRRDASGKIMWDVFLASPVLGAFLPSGAVVPFNFTEVHQVPISEAGTAIAATPGSRSSNPPVLPLCREDTSICVTGTIFKSSLHYFKQLSAFEKCLPGLLGQGFLCHSKTMMVFATKWF